MLFQRVVLLALASIAGNARGCAALHAACPHPAAVDRDSEHPRTVARTILHALGGHCLERGLLLVLLQAVAPASLLRQRRLGLGDIVIPGIFVALLLRFDAEQAGLKAYNEDFVKPYFHTTFFGYILGLLTTVVVMFLFEAAQPALLYLVPACLCASFLPALLRGETSELLAFNEEAEEEPAKGEDSKKKK